MPGKNSTTKMFEATIEPFFEYGNMLASTMEKAYNMQMESIQGYTRLGIENVNAGFRVKSPEDMVGYMEKQAEMGHKVSEMMVSDAKSCSELGMKFMDGVRSMYESNVKTGVAAAADATSKATSSAKAAA